MAFSADLPIERVGEIIAQHLQSDIEKMIRKELVEAITPKISQMAKEYAEHVCLDCKVAAQEDIATGKLQIIIKINGGE